MFLLSKHFQVIWISNFRHPDVGHSDVGHPDVGHPDVGHPDVGHSRNSSHTLIGLWV